MENIIAPRLTTLGHPQRLAVFRLLMRRHPDDVPAGELAEALALPASTLSAYLATLTQAGLLRQHRVGTSLRYGVAMEAVREMFDYLMLDCCRGRPELCAPADPKPAENAGRGSRRPFNVLFLCSGNSARSIFAETLLRDLGAGRFTAFSAGTRPQSSLNPFAVELLHSKGHDIGLLRSKSVAEFNRPDAPLMDFVFTVCDQAANEDCPAWPGQPVTGHWGIPDPAQAKGTDAEKALAFQRAYGSLSRLISTFTSLSVESLDRLALQNAVDDVALNRTKDTL